MLSRRGFSRGCPGVPWPRGNALAQSQVEGWPSKPIKVIFPTGAGGPSELFRMYAEYIKDKFGQPFLFENRPGGSGSIGVMEVVRSPADGHTLWSAPTALLFSIRWCSPTRRSTPSAISYRSR